MTEAGLETTLASLVKAVIRLWLPLAVAITVVIGLTYASVQQALRQSANDPQIQLSEDGAAAIAGGQRADALVGSQVNMATSLASYLIVYDAKGQVVAASVQLDGAVPPLPPGVLDYVLGHGQERVSWQPRAGVRSAAVVTRVSGGGGGYVLAGRSLREVEVRETQVEQLALAGWLAAMGGSLAVVVVGWFITERWMAAEGPGVRGRGPGVPPPPAVG